MDGTENWTLNNDQVSETFISYTYKCLLAFLHLFSNTLMTITFTIMPNHAILCLLERADRQIVETPQSQGTRIEFCLIIFQLYLEVIVSEVHLEGVLTAEFCLRLKQGFCSQNRLAWKFMTNFRADSQLPYICSHKRPLWKREN